MEGPTLPRISAGKGPSAAEPQAPNFRSLPRPFSYGVENPAGRNPAWFIRARGLLRRAAAGYLPAITMVSGRRLVTRFLAGKVARALGIVLAVTLLTQALLALVPGSIAAAILGPQATAAQVRALNRAPAPIAPSSCGTSAGCRTRYAAISEHQR